MQEQVKERDLHYAIALGADAVSIGQGILVALGCNSETYIQDGTHHCAIEDYTTLGTVPGACHNCHTGKCSVGVTTQYPILEKRLEVEVGTKRVKTLPTNSEYGINHAR